MLPSRLWELAFGAILAIAIKKSLLGKLQNNSTLSEILSITGFSLILIGFFIIKEDTRFPSSYTLFPTIGSILVIGFANEKNLIGRILSLRFFVFIGLISYSAYLWHHPLFAFTKHLTTGEQSFIQKIILSALVIPLSYLSWKYVENPFRNKEKFSKKFIFVFSAIGSLFFVSIGYIGIKNNGFPNRSINTKLEYRDYFPDNRQLKKDSWPYVDKMKKDNGNTSWYDSTNVLPNVLLIGNSHSKDMYNTFLSSDQFQNHFEMAIYNDQIESLANHKNDLYNSLNYKEANLIMVVSHCYKEDLDYLEPLVENLLSDDKKIALIKEPYKYKIINSRTVADRVLHKYLKGDSINEDKDSTVVYLINKESYDNRMIEDDELKKQADLIIDQIKLNNKEIIILDRNDYICNQKEKICYVINNDFQKFNYDARHTTIEGAVFFGNRIDEVQWLAPVIKLYNNSS